MVTKVRGASSQTFQSRADMKAYDAPVGAVLYLNEGGRSGEGVVKSGIPPSDPQEGVYVVLNNGNYWKRVHNIGEYRAEWFGVNAANDGQDELAAWQAAVNFASSAVDGAQGAYVRCKTGVTEISATLNLPNRVAISGENGRGLVFKPHSSFASTQMFFAANGTSSMFGSRIENCYIDARGKNMTQVILSYAWQETCGLINTVIQFDGTTQFGLFYQNGYGGAAYLPIVDCEIFADTTNATAAAIRVDDISLVGGFVLSIDGLTVAGSVTNPLPSGIVMDNDSMTVKGYHIEYCDTGIIMNGSGSLSVDTFIGSSNAVIDLIAFGGSFSGKISAVNIIPNGATGQSVKNNVTGTNIPASKGMIPSYVYPSVLSENTALAWVVFDGSLGNILSSFNVDSVTKNATGDYTINYSDTLVSGERAISWSTNVDSVDAVVVTTTGSTSSTDAIKVRRLGSFAGAYYDAQRVKIVVFGKSVV